MAHHIAEIIIRLDDASADERPALERECAHEIQQLWTLRRHYPTTPRPMESFEAMYRTLERLSPDQPQWSYFNHFGDDPPHGSDQDIDLLKVAVKLETAARDVARTLVVEAAAIAETREAKWVEAASHIKDEEAGVLAQITRIRRSYSTSRIEDDPLTQTDEAIRALDTMIRICSDAKSVLATHQFNDKPQ